MSSIVGIGTHITECLRIARMIERHGELFINRVYSTREILFCSRRRHATQQFAAHWAAKEAVIKAIGTSWQPGIRFSDVEIGAGDHARLDVTFRGGVRDLAQQRGIRAVLLATSYCRSHATAYAVALSADATGLPPHAVSDAP